MDPDFIVGQNEVVQTEYRFVLFLVRKLLDFGFQDRPPPPPQSETLTCCRQRDPTAPPPSARGSASRKTPKRSFDALRRGSRLVRGAVVRPRVPMHCGRALGEGNPPSPRLGFVHLQLMRRGGGGGALGGYLKRGRLFRLELASAKLWFLGVGGSQSQRTPPPLL